MQYLKFKIIVSIFSVNLVLAFAGSECFDKNYKISITHKSAPFGLLSKTIAVEKNKCAISVSHNSLKYKNISWKIDVCRKPIHIKETTGSISVIRKIGACSTVKNKFCSEYLTLKKVIEDDGLIFAEGDKSDLNSDHGKMYCTYLLLNKYLDESLVFNSGTNYDYLTRSIKPKDSTLEQLNVVDEDAGFGEF